MKVDTLSPGTLAFVGDGVYGLLVRRALAEVNRPAGQLHELSVKLVSASAQSKAMDEIEPMLTQKEIDVFKRGRNAHVKVPKSATSVDYHRATGLETLFGYLYLDGQKERTETLFNKIWETFSGNI